VQQTLGVVLKHSSDHGASRQGARPSGLMAESSEPGSRRRAPGAGDGLIDRTCRSWARCAGAGLPVSMAESLDAGRAVAVIDLLDREQLRAAYAATVVKHAAHRPPFDRLFDLWWPPAIGDGRAG
jgi:uncharacterized protein with von Willebrand factor type A (vWA) domain